MLMQDSVTSFLMQILSIDSTTGNELALIEYLINNHRLPGARIKLQTVSKTQKNIFFIWGEPKIIFCTHLDTVAPYIQPKIKGDVIYGRGACDAKGQIALIYETCLALHRENQTDFGILLTAGEETTSLGAKIANRALKKTKFIVVCEPTNRKLVSAAKGILAAAITVSGKSAHSGYPHRGQSAINRFIEFIDYLNKIPFPKDDLLGNTTYNLGLLTSDNVPNVLSDKLTTQILFRTTFVSHQIIQNKLQKLAFEYGISLRLTKSSPPINFFTPRGFSTDTVSFGSDAPSFYNVDYRLMYGPGNILHAHTLEEQLKLSSLACAIKDLKKLYYTLFKLI